MRKLSLSLTIMIFMIFFFWGCAGFLKGYGAINPDRSVTQAFETFQINPNYNYYYSGSDVYPNALIGLDKKFKIEPDLWKKLEPAPKAFKDLITQMQSKALSLGQFQHGFAILDDNGRPIGAWYSILRAATTVKMMDDQTILIYQPPLNTYTKYEDDKERLH